MEDQPIVKEEELKEAGIVPEASLKQLTPEEVAQLGAIVPPPVRYSRVSKHGGSNNHGKGTPKSKQRIVRETKRRQRRKK